MCMCSILYIYIYIYIYNHNNRNNEDNGGVRAGSRVLLQFPAQERLRQLGVLYNGDLTITSPTVKRTDNNNTNTNTT